jgi:hypothetical protein
MAACHVKQVPALGIHDKDSQRTSLLPIEEPQSSDSVRWGARRDRLCAEKPTRSRQNNTRELPAMNHQNSVCDIGIPSRGAQKLQQIEKVEDCRKEAVSPNL